MDRTRISYIERILKHDSSNLRIFRLKTNGRGKKIGYNEDFTLFLSLVWPGKYLNGSSLTYEVALPT
uniref:Uncharacterized protein n=1 Tax=Picea glauca TaxID=3330 RepID=A0A117NH45_PICGL|nr:hypothetical protein ABT39_MTgene5925 [Picea glauca]